MVRVTQVLVFIALATAGAVWIPLIRVGETVLELANVGDLLLIACACCFVLARRLLNAPLLLNLIALLLFLLAAGFLLRGERGLGPVILSTPALLAAYALVNLEPLSARQLEAPTAFALAAFFGLFVISSIAAGTNLPDAVLRYVATLDRNAFVYSDLRPVWNAYASGEELEYLASVINGVSAAFTLFFLLSATLATNGSRLMLLCAVISLGWVIVLFSASAILTCVLGISVLAARQIIQSGHRPTLSALWFPALAIVCLPFAGYVILFLDSNVASDTASWSSRLAQYRGAFDTIDARPLLGSGTVTVDGHKIHNLPLFSWSAAGFPSFLVAIAIYVCVSCIVLDGIAGSFRRGPVVAEYLIMSVLPILLVVRTLVGGAGGVPSGAAMTAIAVVLLVRRNLRRSGEEFLLDGWRSGGRAPGAHRPAAGARLRSQILVAGAIRSRGRDEGRRREGP